MRIIVVAALLVATALVAGCASDKGINETGYSDKPLVDREGNKLTSAEAQRLYRSAHDFLIHDDPEKALPLYANIGARFPFSPFADQAALETVTAHYRAENYANAIKAADRYIKANPRSANVDYVYYMRGLSNFKYNKQKILGAPPDLRSVDHLGQAFADFRLLIQNYPNSIYAADARQHMIAIRNRVADFNLRIASYYLARHAYVGASRRAQKIVARYPGAEAIPQALQIMEQSYAALQLPALAADTRALIQESYPNYILHGDRFVDASTSDGQGAASGSDSN